ncbi:unnamed protein product [Amaranthus hypochondriacus]
MYICTNLMKPSTFRPFLLFLGSSFFGSSVWIALDLEVEEVDGLPDSDDELILEIKMGGTEDLVLLPWALVKKLKLLLINLIPSVGCQPEIFDVDCMSKDHTMTIHCSRTNTRKNLKSLMLMTDLM